jgi:purine-binding chemotaxis protein CheW
MQRLFLIATLAGTEIAISSDCIESVVNVGEAVVVPQSNPLIAGLFALRSRVLTLIDCQYAVTGQPAGEKSPLAVIAVIGGHAYGLLVDAVKDVVSVDASSVRTASKLDPRWSSIVTDVVEIEGRVTMLLSPDLLLTPKMAMAA